MANADTDMDARDERSDALERFARAGQSPVAREVALPAQSWSVGGDRAVGAIEVAVYRDEARVLQKIKALAAAAGDDWYYRFPVKSKEGKGFVEGPSIKLANDLARLYGNCDIDTRVQDLGDSWLIYARFTDFETGFSMTRPFQQRKSQNVMKTDADRARDIAFQIGVSKAIRNVVVNALQTFSDFGFEEAKGALIDKIGKKLPEFRQRVVDRLASLKIDARRVEAIRGRPAAQWLAADVAMTIAEIQAINDGMASPDDTWPQVAGSDAKAEPAKSGLDEFANDRRETVATDGGEKSAVMAATEQADAGTSPGTEGGEPKTETAAAHTASPPADNPPEATTPAEGDSRPADASPRASRGTAQEPDASSGASEAAGEATSQPKPRPAAAFSAADKKRLTAYSKALENATSVGGLQKASQRGWEGDMPDEGTQLDQAMQIIFTAHMKRVQGEESIANTDNAVRKIIG